MDKKSAIIIRISLVFMILSVFAICFFWMPSAADYMKNYLAEILTFENTEYVIYVFGALIAIPLLIVFVMAFSLPKAVVNDAVFTNKTAETIKNISAIIFADCLLFFIGTLFLAFCKEKILSPIFLFVCLIGFMVAVMLYILSKYIKSATALKEEADYTL